jgi:Holliday junction resolvase
MSGKCSRSKGARTERSIVNALQANGIAAVRVPLSGAVGGRFAGDIVLPLMGRDLCIEVKARADGYCELFCWLNERGLLIVKADRQGPFVAVRLSLAAEIAKLGAVAKLGAAAPVFGIAQAVEYSLDIGVPGS